jgi:hypothetical protein
MRIRFALWLLLAPVGCGGVLGPAPATPSFPPPRSEREADARARFLEARLDAGRLHAQAWQWGWTAINGGSMVYSTLEAARTDDAGDRAYQTVQAATSLLGLADVQMLRPMPGRDGAAPMRTGDPATRLERGERLLAERAQRAQERRYWRTHLANVAIQALGAGVLLALDQPRYAALSFASGVAGGEAYIWSEPWRPERDLRDYEQLVESQALPREPPVSLDLEPIPDGLALRIAY